MKKKESFGSHLWSFIRSFFLSLLSSSFFLFLHFLLVKNSSLKFLFWFRKVIRWKDFFLVEEEIAADSVVLAWRKKNGRGLRAESYGWGSDQNAKALLEMSCAKTIDRLWKSDETKPITWKWHANNLNLLGRNCKLARGSLSTRWRWFHWINLLILFLISIKTLCTCRLTEKLLGLGFILGRKGVAFHRHLLQGPQKEVWFLVLAPEHF